MRVFLLLLGLLTLASSHRHHHKKHEKQHRHEHRHGHHMGKHHGHGHHHHGHHKNMHGRHHRIHSMHKRFHIKFGKLTQRSGAPKVPSFPAQFTADTVQTYQTAAVNETQFLTLYEDGTNMKQRYQGVGYIEGTSSRVAFNELIVGGKKYMYEQINDEAVTCAVSPAPAPSPTPAMSYVGTTMISTPDAISNIELWGSRLVDVYESSDRVYTLASDSFTKVPVVYIVNKGADELSVVFKRVKEGAPAANNFNIPTEVQCNSTVTHKRKSRGHKLW